MTTQVRLSFINIGNRQGDKRVPQLLRTHPLEDGSRKVIGFSGYDFFRGSLATKGFYVIEDSKELLDVVVESDHQLFQVRH